MADPQYDNAPPSYFEDPAGGGVATFQPGEEAVDTLPAPAPAAAPTASAPAAATNVADPNVRSTHERIVSYMAEAVPLGTAMAKMDLGESAAQARALRLEAASNAESAQRLVNVHAMMATMASTRAASQRRRYALDKIANSKYSNYADRRVGDSNDEFMQAAGNLAKVGAVANQAQATLARRSEEESYFTNPETMKIMEAGLTAKNVATYLPRAADSAESTVDQLTTSKYTHDRTDQSAVLKAGLDDASYKKAVAMGGLAIRQQNADTSVQNALTAGRNADTRASSAQVSADYKKARLGQIDRQFGATQEMNDFRRSMAQATQENRSEDGARKDFYVAARASKALTGLAEKNLIQAARGTKGFLTFDPTGAMLQAVNKEAIAAKGTEAQKKALADYEATRDQYEDTLGEAQARFNDFDPDKAPKAGGASPKPAPAAAAPAATPAPAKPGAPAAPVVTDAQVAAFRVKHPEYDPATAKRMLEERVRTKGQ